MFFIFCFLFMIIDNYIIMIDKYIISNMKMVSCNCSIFFRSSIICKNCMCFGSSFKWLSFFIFVYEIIEVVIKVILYVSIVMDIIKVYKGNILLSMRSKGLNEMKVIVWVMCWCVNWGVWGVNYWNCWLN